MFRLRESGCETVEGCWAASATHEFLGWGGLEQDPWLYRDRAHQEEENQIFVEQAERAVIEKGDRF